MSRPITVHGVYVGCPASLTGLVRDVFLSTEQELVADGFDRRIANKRAWAAAREAEKAVQR